MKNKKTTILKWIMVICLAVSMMGCSSTTKETSSAGEETNSIKEETSSSKEETKVELQTAEHPSVIKESIRHLRVVKDGKTSFEVVYDPQEYKNNADYWEILVPYQSTVVVDTEAMYALYELVSAIDFSAPAVEGEDVDTGIEGATDSIYVEYDAGQKEGKAGQADPTASYLLKLGKEDGNGNRYASLDGFEDQVYLVSQTSLNNIFQVNPYEMILKVVNLVDSATLSQVDISFGDKKHTLTKLDEQYTYDGKQIKESKFSEYYTAILSIFIQKEIPADVHLEENREKLGEIVYQRTTEEAKTSITTFYAYDDEYCTVNVDGVECFMVLKSDVEQLDEIFL